MNRGIETIKSSFLIACALLMLLACDKEVEEVNIDADAGRSFSDMATEGYSVKLDALMPENGQVGTWYMFKGKNGRFEEVNNPKTMFFGEPGEHYVLGWEVKQGDKYSVSEITVSFREMIVAMKTELPDTLLGNVSVYLDAMAPEFGETGEWSIIEGEGGQILNPNDAKAGFVGKAETQYKVRWTMTFGSKTAYIERSFYTSTLKAWAGDDNTDIITGGREEVRYYNLDAQLPAGATGSWTILDGENGTVLSTSDAKSLFSGTVDTNYRLVWNVSVNEYTSSDTLDLRFRGKWGVYTDPRDGQKYRYVELNGKQWFADNLNYNASFSQYGRSWYYGQSYRAIIIDGYAIETDEDRKRYGRLYNWYGAMDALPPEWRLPTNEDYEELVAFLGGSFAYSDMIEGGESGLELVFAGMAGQSNNNPDARDVFQQQDEACVLWTSNYFERDFSAIAIALVNGTGGGHQQIRVSAFWSGFSVRAIRDIN
ncbi:FISUMP domain-containing protein [Carboxylicivirga sp. RSCT41]|uniref:FISUMP domain-containing protein n=1 Tax=Carboxylicivirga agarovorans TaxID=3417570 RepID=UPI003D3543F9